MRGELATVEYVITKVIEHYITITGLKSAGNKKPILVPITRKGYWLFYVLRREAKRGNNDELDTKFTELVNKFEIYSDRYLTKLINNKELKDRHVLLFDDTFNSGNNMFYYYALLTLWGADVYPATCERVLPLKKDDCTLQGEKWRNFIEVAQAVNSENILLNDNHNISLQKDIGQIYQMYLREFYKRFDEFDQYQCRLIAQDIPQFSIRTLRWVEKEICPMVVDLPIVVQAVDEDGLNPQKIILNEEQWGRLKDNESAKWCFVDNIVEEVPELSINASFFVAPNDLKNKLPIEIVADAIVKCKYHQEGDNVKIVFVPFAIMKSICYEDLIDCFVELFKGTPYFEEICENMAWKGKDSSKIIEEAYIDIKNNVNLYRVMYRAVVLYISSYIGMEFKKYFAEVTGETAYDYDWKFMKEHLPQRLIEAIKCEFSESSDYIEKKLSKVLTRHYKNYLESNNTGITQRKYATWKAVYYPMSFS